MIKKDAVVYLSGPMTGYKNYNHAEFNRISEKLEGSGHFKKVINPASMDEGEKPWQYYLIRDIGIIFKNKVDAVILMKGWEKSKGARAEVFNAVEILDADIYLYEDDEWDGFKLIPFLPSFEKPSEKGVMMYHKEEKFKVKAEPVTT
jgi:hypothetical protein